MRDRFWEKYSLEELSAEEWEALCDGCAWCCLHTLQDEDSGDIAVTRVACAELDIAQCRCKNYSARAVAVPDCTQLTPARSREFRWLPDTCAYRRLAQQRALPYWHYLISGDKAQVHTLGVSVRDLARSRGSLTEEAMQDHVLRWVD